MKLLHKIIIVILILLVLGLYFRPEITKSIIKSTGHATYDVSKQAVEKIKESETAKNINETIKENIPFNGNYEK